MSNPFEQYSPGSSAPLEASALTWLGQRRSSYARVASGIANYSVAAPFSHLLNPGHDDNECENYDGQRTDGTTLLGSAEQGRANMHNWHARNPQLPSYSRAFEPLLRGHPSNSVSEPAIHQNFFTPSYLQGSAYAQRLEEAHNKKLSTRRDVHQAGGLRNNSSLGLQGNKVTSASYRGPAFDVVEKPPAFEDQEIVAALPSKWNQNDKAPGLDILSDGMEVKYAAGRSSANSTDRDHEAWAVRADHYMPPQCGLYYFEVTILKKRDDAMASIGFTEASTVLTRALGWEPNSWGYHGDDGHLFASQNVGKHYGPKFALGDVIGCGVNFRDGTAFYTRNGKNLGIAFRDVKGNNLKLFPTVGLKRPGEHVRVNFGQTPFVFDISGMMKVEKVNTQKQISVTSTANIAPSLNETELIQQLVLQFLQHDGYIETARAFASEMQAEKQALNLDQDAQVKGIDITDDDDANNRQSIRKAILEGDIDYALKKTKLYYPRVLQDHEQVHFRLRCRKFIEMIRREAELNMTGGWNGTRSNGHAMDIDVEDASDGELQNAVPADDDATTHGQQDRVAAQQQLEALQYGQKLHAEFGSDARPEVRKALQDIFALMAYPNPLKEKEVAHLLDRKGRAAVAEELNSAILQSLGQSSRAALEQVIAQTTVLLEDLRQDGGPGAFVTLQDVMDPIPKSQPF